MSLTFDGLVEDKGSLFFFAEEYNALCNMEWDTGMVRLLSSVSRYNAYAHNLYLNMVKCNNKIVLIPYLADTIGIYDINNKKLHMTELNNQSDRFFSAVSYKDKVFMVGNNIAKICIFDINKNSIKTIYEEKIKNEWGNSKVFCRKNRTVVGNKFYFSIYFGHRIAEINMESEEVKIYSSKDFPESIRIMCHERDDIFWLNECNTTRVLRWSLSRGILGDYTYNEEGYDDYRVGDMYFVDKLWLFPTVGADVLTFSPETNTWKKEDNLIEFGSKVSSNKHIYQQTFPLAVRHKDEFLIYAGNTSELIKFSFDGKKVCTRRICNNESFEIKLNNGTLLKERADYRVDSYVKGVMYME